MISTEIPPVVRPQELEELLTLREDVRLIDVRTPGEYETAHLPGAYNVPLDTLGEHAKEIRSVVDRPVVLICQSGMRARKAEEALKAAGMPNLHILEGGVNGWVRSGRFVRRGAKRLTLERQVRILAGALAATGSLLALAANPIFALLPALVGSGLMFAGITDTCGMAMMLSRLPYNRPVSCDVDAMVRALREGAPPAGVGRATVAVPVSPTCAA